MYHIFALMHNIKVLVLNILMYSVTKMQITNFMNYTSGYWCYLRVLHLCVHSFILPQDPPGHESASDTECHGAHSRKHHRLDSRQESYQCS